MHPQSMICVFPSLFYPPHLFPCPPNLSPHLDTTPPFFPPTNFELKKGRMRPPPRPFSPRSGFLPPKLALADEAEKLQLFFFPPHARIPQLGRPIQLRPESPLFLIPSLFSFCRVTHRYSRSPVLFFLLFFSMQKDGLVLFCALLTIERHG